MLETWLDRMALCLGTGGEGILTCGGGIVATPPGYGAVGRSSVA